MARAKGSRKGKKAWRRNVDASAEQAVLEAAPVPGPSATAAVAALPDAALFFVDKASSASAAPTPLARKPRGPDALKRPLRCQLIVSNPRAGAPPLTGPPRKAVGRVKPPPGAVPAALATPARPAPLARRPADSDDELAAPVDDAWADPAAAAAAARSAARARSRPRPTPVPALEVDPAGCSFNPDPVAHQDAIAIAVAAEVGKELKKELAARPPCAAVVSARPGGAWDGLGEGLVVAAAETSSSEDEGREGGEEGAGGGGPARPARRPERKTTAQRNRAARAREADAAAATAAVQRAARGQLGSLKKVKREIDAREAEAEAARARRAADRAERAKVVPPKLGRGAYVPAPLHVLTSDEVTGSLRILRPAAGVLRDRFAALQKRGVIEPRLPAARRKGALVAYLPGGRAERAAEGQAALERLRAANRKRKAEVGALAVAGGGDESD